MEATKATQILTKAYNPFKGIDHIMKGTFRLAYLYKNDKRNTDELKSFSKQFMQRLVDLTNPEWGTKEMIEIQRQKTQARLLAE